MQKQKIALIAGIFLAVIAVFLIKVYLSQQRLKMEEQKRIAISRIKENQAVVLIAKQDIAKGSTIEPAMLDTQIIPVQYLQPKAVNSLDRIANMVTTAPISRGEQITLNKLVFTQDIASGGSLAMATPMGKRAVTIAVDNISSLAGMLRAGDYVDVISLINVPVQTADGKQTTEFAVVPVFQNVLVLAVGQELHSAVAAEPQARTARYKKDEEKREASSLVTLALNPQEANLIAFVQEQSKMRLILRSPADSQIQQVQPANWDTLFKYMMPKEQASVENNGAPSEYVDVYRGLSKDKIVLSP